MIDNGYYSQEVHGPYELHDIGNLELEEGGGYVPVDVELGRQALPTLSL